MTTRTVLPNRRPCETFDFEHAPDRGMAGIRYTATVGYGTEVGEEPDHKVKLIVSEVFLNSSKLGSGSDSSARDAAIATSIALQYGARLQTLCRAVTRNEDGSPASPIGRLLDILAEQIAEAEDMS